MLFDSVTKSKGDTMRGGKREGAGRKGYGQTKTYRLPIALEPEITKLLKKYKAGLDRKREVEATKLDSVTKSKEHIKPVFPVLNRHQLKTLRAWLVDNKFVPKHQVKKLTNTPKSCKEAYLKYTEVYFSYHDEIKGKMINLCELYCVDD